MKELIEKINNLREGSGVSCMARERIREFEEKQKEDSRKWFLELCFCLLTANSGAKKVLGICESLGEDAFFDYSVEDLSSSLKEKGYRFYNKRAQYIVEARRFSDCLEAVIISFDDELKAREWLVCNVKGLGYKEASHFLRNVGYKDVAILDRHILRVLNEYGLIQEVPTNLTKKNYYAIEEKICDLAERSNLSLAELDLYLWYMQTGEVVK
jgi:N-glycosylase/DNA lyase